MSLIIDCLIYPNKNLQMKTPTVTLREQLDYIGICVVESLRILLYHYFIKCKTHI